MYVDKTYVNAWYTTGKCWQSPQEIRLASPIGKANRIIIVHGGGEEQGFIEGVLVIFTAKQKSGDYHESMNYDNFRKWVEEKLVAKLTLITVVVMDNAAFQCIEEDRKPSSNSFLYTD